MRCTARRGHQCHYFVPIRSRTPITFYPEGPVLIGTRIDPDAIRCCPLRPRTEIAHQTQGQVDVRTRNDVPRQMQGQPSGKNRAYHQQSGNILRTDMPRHRHFLPPEPGARNAQRRETLLACIFNLCPQASQGIHQDADGTLLHPGGTGQKADARPHTQVSRKETHGSARSSDIHDIRRMFKGADHHMCIITIAQIVRTDVPPGQGMEDEYTIADAFRRRQVDESLQVFGGMENILHERLMING